MSLKKDFLSKPGGQWRPIRLLDVAVLLWHIHRGAQDDAIGFEDAGQTVETITNRLNKQIMIDPALLESGLWSCNLADEQGKFWHPRAWTFDQYVARLLGPGERFNRFYNLIEKVKKT